MKVKLTLTPSKFFQDAKKSHYSNPVVVDSLDAYKDVAMHD